MRFTAGCLSVVVFCLAAASSAAVAGDQAQWGQRHSRNMVSDEQGLPDSFEPQTGKNVKWSAALGSECYATPVIAEGRVFIGTNNERPRDARHQGDRGVLMCFDEADGRFLWQLVVPKLEGDIYLDWPRAGVCSSVTVEGDRVYTATNRDEVVCLDIHGMENGNDGPYQDEARHMTPRGEPLVEVGPTDADILWLLDLRTAAGVRPHDSVHCSLLLDGPYLYANTNNGLNSKHDGVEKPEAPCLVAIDKATGRLMAQEREGIAKLTFHSNWSAPALGEVSGRRLVFFGGGDGVCYAFNALGSRGAESPASAASQEKKGELLSTEAGIQPLELIWRFDCDPGAPKENIHTYIRNRRESPSNIKSTVVFDQGRLYVTVGGDIWWGKHEAWLQCIDATRTGDITSHGLVWSYPLDQHCCSTPSIQGDLVFVADCGGKVHCVDAATGRAHWVHDAEGEMWSSTLVADGKVYVGTRRGQFWILNANKELKVLSSIRLPDPVISTSVAANDVLYVGTMTTLYAVQSK